MQRRSTTSHCASRSSGDDAVSMLEGPQEGSAAALRHRRHDSRTKRPSGNRGASVRTGGTPTLEEEPLYRQRGALNDEELIDEAEIKHQSVKALIAELCAMDANDRSLPRPSRYWPVRETRQRRGGQSISGVKASLTDVFMRKCGAQVPAHAGNGARIDRQTMPSSRAVTRASG